MNYQSFLEEVERRLKETLPENAALHLFKVQKNNGGTLDALGIFTPDTDKSPTIYLNEFYEAYEKGVPIPGIISRIMELFTRYRNFPFQESLNLRDFDSVKPLLACKLIHKESNHGLLKEVPYRPFLDLAIVCYLYLTDNDSGSATMLIGYPQLALWHLSEEDLFRCALENSPKLLPVSLMSMEEIMKELYPDLTDIPPSSPMFVLTNAKRYFGAAVILYPEVLKSFAEAQSSDFYLLPSSIHEVILLPVKYPVSKEALAVMVNEINTESVPQEDWLSNHVYYYSRSQGALLC